MKKSTLNRFLLICCLCITVSTTRAQYAPIPDNYFGYWLSLNGFSSCLTGSFSTSYSLDTTCASVLSDTSINCYSFNIHDLTGIRYFKHLKYLDFTSNPISILSGLPATLINLNCTSDSLHSLPILPPGLTNLNCSYNPLGSLPTLSDSLILLTCSYDQLTSLPALPAKLYNLMCDHNQLSSLPGIPASLIYINCQDNQITSLPAFPSSFSGINCSYNHITSIPTLPGNFSTLDCSFNQITSLPSLPTYLGTLYCENNQITTLPPLPQTQGYLAYINCSNNLLTSLPTLPPSLINFWCNNNLLTSLPSLPSTLSQLECGGNPLTSLPALPHALTTLYCDHTQISSLPSLPASVTSLDCAGDHNLSCLPRIHQNAFQIFYIDSSSIQCLPNRFTATTFDINPSTMNLGCRTNCTYLKGSVIEVLLINSIWCDIYGKNMDNTQIKQQLMASFEQELDIWLSEKDNIKDGYEYETRLVRHHQNIGQMLMRLSVGDIPASRNKKNSRPLLAQ